MFICVCRLHAIAIRTHSRDSDPIRIRVRCGPDTITIRIPIYGMIQRSVPVRAVKTRRWFGSKIISFHVSVCSCIIFLFIVISIIYMLLVLFHVTVWYIIPVWLHVSFHVMSVSAHFIYTIDISIICVISCDSWLPVLIQD